MMPLEVMVPKGSVQKMKVIDVDTHLTEPHDLWTRLAPKSLMDKVPQVKIRNGQKCWVIDGDKPLGNGATSCIKRDGSKPSGLEFAEWDISEVHAASYNTEARIKQMNDSGIWAQIVYPNLLGFGGQNAQIVEPNLRLSCVEIYNDAMAEIQATSSDRICPMALLPWWDVSLSVKELERCARMGLKGININSDPQNHVDLDGNPLPDLANPLWDPLWELCEDKNLPVNFHIGASEQSVDWYGDAGWPSLSDELKVGLGGAMLFLNNGRVMSNLIYSGLLDRYSNLKFVSVESGIGWVPFMMEAIDYHYEQIDTRRALKMRPSEYFTRNFFACFWFERRDITYMINAVGVDNCMFESDFPHLTCLYPNAIEFAEESLRGLDLGAKRKVMGGNASKVYSIPLTD